MGAVAGRAGLERAREAICSGEQSFLGIGTALYVMAEQRLNGPNRETGASLLELAAAAYAHPLALIRRAQLRIHSLHATSISAEEASQALLMSWLDLQSGRATASWMAQFLGAEELARETEQEALGLLEAFAAGAVPGSLDLAQAQATFERQWPERLRQLEALYRH